MYLQYCGGTFFAIPFLGLSVSLLPSLAIGAGAFGASELLLNTGTGINKLKDNNKNLYDILMDAKNKNKQIELMTSKIDDKELVNNIKEIHDSVSKIIETVEKKPEKYKAVDNFFDYYLPVTIKILTKYDEIENQGLSTEDGKKFMSSTKNMIKKINNAFKKQLSNLYQSDMIDSDAEMKVFETMLKSDGFDDSSDFDIK